MFRIFPYRDLLNNDPAKRRKIKGYIVECGYSCRSSCWCHHECKYRPRYRWHNFSVEVSRFLKMKFNINFHLPVYFQKHSADLSGTTKCPYKMPRMYTCWDCEYSGGYRSCTNEERHKLINEGKWSEIDYPFTDVEHRRLCKLFKHNKWCQNYDRKTGEILHG